MTHTALVKLAQVVDAKVWRDKTAVRAGRELFHSGALRLVGDKVPVVVNHDRDRPIGRVRRMMEFDDTDGRWIFAQVDLDRPPEWVRRGTAASFAGAHLLDPHDMPGGWTSSHSALVTEVSLLTPPEKPAEPRAQVVLLQRMAATTSTPTSRASAPPAVGGEEFYSPPGTVLRRPGGHVIGIR